MATSPISTYRCPICDHCSEHARIARVSTHEAIDLDLRPSASTRGPLDQWLIECPHCTYVSNGDDGRPVDDQEKDERWSSRHGPFVNPKFLGHEALVEVRTQSPLSDTASRFMRRSLIDQHLGRLWLAAYHCLSAAWVCDDEHRTALAVDCRVRTAMLIQQFLAVSDPSNDTATVRLVLMDVLRRASRFDEARAEGNALAARSDLNDQEFGILRYQLVLIDNEVRSRETIASAFD